MPPAMKAKKVSMFGKAGGRKGFLKRTTSNKAKKLESVSEGVDMKLFKQYEVAMRERVDQGKIPGYCSTMLRHGKILHSDAYGYADIERGTKYGPNTIMRLFCMTKPFVATAILRLHEQGKLSVHDDLAKYFPKYKNLRVVTTTNSVLASKKTKNKITILHCLTHSSGIGYSTGWNYKCESAEQKMYEDLSKRTERGEITSLKEWADAFTELPLRTEPGTSFCYSHSLDVLGRVIEIVSGKSLGRYLQDNIFKPLNMQDTGYSFPKSKAGRVAALYGSPKTAANLGADKATLPRSKEALCRVDGKTVAQSRWMEGNVCPVQSGGGFMGDNMGGLVSTLNDCIKFFAMISNGGGRIVKESTLNRYVWRDMLPEVCTNKQKGDHRGFNQSLGFSALGEFGLKKNAREAKQKSHMYDYDIDEVGMGGAACTYYSMDPRRKTVTLWCTQQLDNEAFTKGSQSLWHVNRRAVPLLPKYCSEEFSSMKRKSGNAKADSTSQKRRRTAAV